MGGSDVSKRLEDLKRHCSAHYEELRQQVVLARDYLRKLVETELGALLDLSQMPAEPSVTFDRIPGSIFEPRQTVDSLRRAAGELRRKRARRCTRMQLEHL